MKIKSIFKQTWFWLSIIALGIFIGIILFSFYLYKKEMIKIFDLRVFITNENGYYDMQIFWSAISAIIALGVGVATLNLNRKLKKIQQKQAELYSIPHTMIDDVKYEKAVLEMNRGCTRCKSLKNIDYPFFNNTIGKMDFDNMILVKISLVNTSDAFARIRLCQLQIEKSSNIIAIFNGNTFGDHNHHAFLKQYSKTTIGFVINQSLLPELENATITLSCFLDNNFNETYKETQTITLISVSDDYITFMPTLSKQNGTVLIE